MNIDTGGNKKLKSNVGYFEKVLLVTFKKLINYVTNYLSEKSNKLPSKLLKK